MSPYIFIEYVLPRFLTLYIAQASSQKNLQGLQDIHMALEDGYW